MLKKHIISAMRRFLLSFFILVLLPIAFEGARAFLQGWPTSWHAADWSETQTVPDLRVIETIGIDIFAARTGQWKGVLADHLWIVIKQENKPAERFEVVGWGRPVRRDAYPIEGHWYSNPPRRIFSMRGRQAALLIPEVHDAIARYPHQKRGHYVLWPGPNSNSFIGWITRAVPELGAELPPTAVGKDFLGEGLQTGAMPSGGGWQLSYSGYAGLGFARHEGFELHFLGLTLGLDPADLAVKLPGIGRIGWQWD